MPHSPITTSLCTHHHHHHTSHFHTQHPFNTNTFVILSCPCLAITAQSPPQSNTCTRTRATTCHKQPTHSSTCVCYPTCLGMRTTNATHTHKRGLHPIVGRARLYLNTPHTHTHSFNHPTIIARCVCTHQRSHILSSFRQFSHHNSPFNLSLQTLRQI
jgi:hypothetical protein